MGYTEDLVRLLRPLGVYSFLEGSFSLGELQAMGLGLDGAEAFLDAGRAEGSVLTASEAGLAQWLALLGVTPVAADLNALRQAVAALLRVGEGSFTPAALTDTLSGCGAQVRLKEEGPGQVSVYFPGVRGEPEDLQQLQAIIEGILPCHLGIRYRFDLLTWDEIGTLTWDEIEGIIWDELEVLRPEEVAG